MNDDTKKGDLIEKLTDALHNKNLFGEVVKFKSFLCDGVVSSRVVFGTVIHAMTKTNQHNKVGTLIFFYKKPSKPLSPQSILEKWVAPRALLSILKVSYLWNYKRVVMECIKKDNKIRSTFKSR